MSEQQGFPFTGQLRSTLTGQLNSLNSHYIYTEIYLFNEWYPLVKGEDLTIPFADIEEWRKIHFKDE